MPGAGASQLAAMRSVRIAAVAVAFGMIGAAPNPLPVLAKSDRIASPADCRFQDLAGTVECLGVVLPDTVGEPVTVAPGLSVVGQVPG